MLLHILVICRSTLKKANAHLIAEMASSTSDHHDLVDAPSPACKNVNPIVLSSVKNENKGILHLMFMMPGCAIENTEFILVRTTADACEYKVASDVEMRRATAPNYRMSYRGFCSIPVEFNKAWTTCTAEDGIAHIEARKDPRMFMHARPRVQPRFVYPKYSAHKVIHGTSETDGS